MLPRSSDEWGPLLLCAAVMIPISYLVRLVLSLVIGIPFGLLDNGSARDFIAWLNASQPALVLCYVLLWALLIARVRRS